MAPRCQTASPFSRSSTTGASNTASVNWPGARTSRPLPPIQGRSLVGTALVWSTTPWTCRRWRSSRPGTIMRTVRTWAGGRRSRSVLRTGCVRCRGIRLGTCVSGVLGLCRGKILFFSFSFSFCWCWAWTGRGMMLTV